MNYFTKEYTLYDDRNARATYKQYQTYIASIADRLPQDVHKFLKDTHNGSYLHDGLFISGNYNSKDNILELLLRIGDLQIGYYDLLLKYTDVSFLSDIESLHQCIAKQHTEVLYDKIDITEDNKMVHRILFHPVGEIELQYSKCSYTLIPKPNREFIKESMIYV